MSKKQITSTYDLVATTYDQIGPRFFSYSGQRIVELAQIPRAASVLDIATGRGAILFPASLKVGRHGRVIGIDRSAGMLREVARDNRQKNMGQTKICQMDAEQLSFANGSFDYVFCGHAIYYFPQALHEFYRILKPAGQVGITIVTKGCLDWILEIIDRYLHNKNSEVDEQEDNESIAINTEIGLEKVLDGAGFESILVVKEETDFIYVDEEEWWSVLRTMGVRWALEKMDTKTVDSIKAEMFDYLQGFKRSDGIHILYSVLYSLGYKPLH